MGNIRDTVSDLARERGEFPQFSPEVDLAPLADATETAIGVAVAAVAFDAEDIVYDNDVSGLIANNVQEAINKIVDRVEALEDADPPAPSSGEFDVTVTTLLLNADVGKVVQNSGVDPFTDGSGVEVYDTTKTPVGVLVSVDGLGGGVVRRWGVGPCIAALNSDVGLVEAKNGGNVGAAVGGSSVYVGRILTNNGMGQLGTMFVTAIATVGLVPAA